MTEEDTTKFSVTEDKFNAVVTLKINGAEDREEAEWMARHYFRNEYGHSPSRIIVQIDKHSFDRHGAWEAMVADHSSGSLKGTTEYEL